jgi:DNA repair protein RadC
LETGPTCLSLRECLAILLGSGPPGLGCLGLAGQILEKPGKGLGNSEEERAFFTAIELLGITHLKNLPGLGPAGQARILAAFELGRRYAFFRYRFHKVKKSKQSLPDLALRALNQLSQKQRTEPQEWLGFVPIHRTGEVGELCLVEKGVRTHVNIDPAELFARLLALRPKAFFLVHNHPSGNPLPSAQDFDLTQRVGSLAKQLGIQLVGHWIVTPDSEHWFTCY